MNISTLKRLKRQFQFRHMFIIAYLMRWLVSTVANVGTWTSSWLFIGRFLFHLLLVITLVVVVMADVRSSSSSNCRSRRSPNTSSSSNCRSRRSTNTSSSNCRRRGSTNTSSLSARKQYTSCTAWWRWLCWSSSRLCREACDQLSKFGVELGVDHLLHAINRLRKSGLDVIHLFRHHLCKFIM